MKTIRPSLQLVTVMFLVTIFSAFSTSSYANDKSDIDNILSKADMPDGVVFELIGSDGQYLTKALAKVQNYQKQLKTKFPKIDIAVVSHGSEQFALTKDNAPKFKKAHSSVKRLIDSDIPVHICETHASWRGVVAEDFPDYIDVAAQGPAQIKQYQEMGYTLVIID